jgi:hypothetical protein
MFTLDAKFLVIDINNFYLNTSLERFEYMVINVSSLPQENDRQVRSDRTFTERKGLHRDSERNVRLATGRHPRQRIVTAQSSQGWISPDDSHTRLMDPRYSAHIILVSSG